MKNWKSFLKLTQRNQPREVPSDSATSNDLDLNADVLSVILLKVDPNTIFKCILVSKHWFQVIVSSCFRRSYMERWKNDLKVVGFMHEYGPFKLVATNKMGSYINITKMWTHGQFVNKSHSGDGLMLFFDLETRVYVLQVGAVILTSLAPPPEPEPESTPTFKEYTTAILSSCNKDGSFKVLRAEVGPRLRYVMTLNIQTFSSSTSKWELSQHQVSCDNFSLLEDSGIGSIRGMVYWRAETPTSYNKLLVYDTNNEPSIRLISGPITCQILPKYHYDVTSQGYLHCATNGRENEIRIWSFDEEDYKWKCLYTLEKARSYSPDIHFLAFVPGRSDSIMVAYIYRSNILTGSNHQIYIYDADTHTMERFEAKYSSKDISNGQLIPFTIADLGIWPSSQSRPRGSKVMSSLKRLCNLL